MQRVVDTPADTGAAGTQLHLCSLPSLSARARSVTQRVAVCARIVSVRAVPRGRKNLQRHVGQLCERAMSTFDLDCCLNVWPRSPWTDLV
jgi:hypothetical protein